MANLFHQKQHLFNRAGFGYSMYEISQTQNLNLHESINFLFNHSQNPTPLSLQYNPPRIGEGRPTAEERKKLQQYNRNKLQELNVNWLNKMMVSPEVLREKVTLFWHGHFACNVKRPYPQLTLNNTIRQHALGNFKTLVLAVAKEPAMLEFLNNQQNKKGQPNENFARELMELFTIGMGNYTEKDVQESARAFTGWMYRRNNRFYFNERQHDFGQKTFMGKTGNYNGDHIVDIILEHKQTATTLCTKFYTHFVNPVKNEKHIKQLSNVFYASGYNIETLMHEIFSSPWFYADENMGSKIKSPAELMVGLGRNFQMSFSDQRLPLSLQKQMNQILFQPPNVAGWNQDRAWINNATLVRRMQLSGILLLPSSGLRGGKDVAKKIKSAPPEVNWNKVDAFCKEKSNSEIADSFLSGKSKQAILPDLRRGRRAFVLQIMSMPEYQMC